MKHIQSIRRRRVSSIRCCSMVQQLPESLEPPNRCVKHRRRVVNFSSRQYSSLNFFSSSDLHRPQEISFQQRTQQNYLWPPSSSAPPPFTVGCQQQWRNQVDWRREPTNIVRDQQKTLTISKRLFENRHSAVRYLLPLKLRFVMEVHPPTTEGNVSLVSRSKAAGCHPLLVLFVFVKATSSFTDHIEGEYGPRNIRTQFDAIDELNFRSALISGDTWREAVQANWKTHLLYSPQWGFLQ